jgi:hypothetical protein
MYIGCKKKSLYLFQCKCMQKYCEKHKQPEDHMCTFDFITDYRKKLEKENIRVVVSKVNHF